MEVSLKGKIRIKAFLDVVPKIASHRTFLRKLLKKWFNNIRKFKKRNNMGWLISNMGFHSFPQNTELIFKPTWIYLIPPHLKAVAQRTMQWRTKLSTKMWAQGQHHPGAGCIPACCVFVIKIHGSWSQRAEEGLVSLTSANHPLAEFVFPSPKNLDSTGLED